MVDARGIGDRNFFASGGFQIDMLEAHRVRDDDFYRGRDFLEKPRVQPVCRSDEDGVGSFGCGEQLLLAERNLARISPGAVIAIDTIFNLLRIAAGYHQNGFSHMTIYGRVARRGTPDSVLFALYFSGHRVSQELRPSKRRTDRCK